MSLNTIKLNFDTAEMEAAIQQYAALSGKSVSDLINRKLGWVLRRALWAAHKTNYISLAAELGQKTRKYGRNPGGRFVEKRKRKKKWFASSTKFKEAPALAIIINARRGKKGAKGLYGKDMQAAFKKVWGARARSIGYLKSGFKAALDPFLPYCSGQSGPPVDNSGRVVGSKKGLGSLANANRLSGFGFIFAKTKRKGSDMLEKFGKPALEKAWADEMRDFRNHLNTALYEAAQKTGIKARR